jgi:uncharacterized protein
MSFGALKRVFLTIIVLSLFISAASASHTKVLGVKESGGRTEGISADLYVEVADGQGRIFVETMPLTEIDTQASARLAADVSCDIVSNIEGVPDCRSSDFFYVLRSDYTMVGGPSAGAAMTVATMAELLNKTIASNVMMTGTINPDGSVGAVGGLVEKVDAAYAAGADIVLIPKGQTMVYVNLQGSLTSMLVNLTTYGKQQWGVDVIEVADVKEAFRYMTGYEIVQTSSSDLEQANVEYNQVMRKVAQNLINYSNIMLNQTRSKLDASSLGLIYSENIRSKLDAAETEMGEASDLFWQGKFYSAASYAVDAGKEISYADKLIMFYQTPSTTAYVNGVLEAVSLNISQVSAELTKVVEIDSVKDIEALMVAVDRIRKAENLLDEAINASFRENLESALDLASFAEIRKVTSLQWSMLKNEFAGDDNLTFNVTKLRSLSQERLEYARISLTYAYANGIGATNVFLSQAEDYLDSAEQAFLKGEYVFSLFASLETKALANLAMETKGMSNAELESKIPDSENAALQAIYNAESRGLLPILARSYLDYGRTFEESSPVTALIFLGYSKEFAKVSYDIVEAMGEADSLLTTEETTLRISTNTTEEDILSTYLFLFCGFLLGILLSMYRIDKKINI